MDVKTRKIKANTMAFYICDKDGDGNVDQEEFENFYK